MLCLQLDKLYLIARLKLFYLQILDRITKRNSNYKKLIKFKVIHHTFEI